MIHDATTCAMSLRDTLVGALHQSLPELATPPASGNSGVATIGQLGRILTIKFFQKRVEFGMTRPQLTGLLEEGLRDDGEELRRIGGAVSIDEGPVMVRDIAHQLIEVTAEYWA
jgi:hypothetical protein